MHANSEQDPHYVIITKSDTGFGFNVKGQISEGGQLRSINGHLLGPCQHVSAILRGGAAQKAGLNLGDNIIEVNEENVEAASHRQVVQLIKKGGEQLKLLVISVPNDEVNGYDNNQFEDKDTFYRYDYAEKRLLPITIPSYQYVRIDGESFVVFKIFMAGRHLSSRRYNDFVQVQKYLKEFYSDYEFPNLPSRWPFKLSESKLDARRRLLQSYLEKICSIKCIADGEIIQDFLMDESEDYTKGLDVTLKIQIPGSNFISMEVKKPDTCYEVKHQMFRQLIVEQEIVPHLALFELVEDNFYRVLPEDESPHFIYIQNYTSVADSSISFRKWIFNIEEEARLCQLSPLFLELCYYQTIIDIDTNLLDTKDKQFQLKSLQSQKCMSDFLEVARTLPTYNRVTFGTCQSNLVSNLTLTVDFNKIKVDFEDPEKVSQIVDWACVKRYFIANNETTFNLEYAVSLKVGASIKILQFFTQNCNAMFLTFDKISKERQQFAT
uniref:Sorting nexin-27 n=1 Tax=Rhabditophanes sp. KR3021 TaxID=114890 RepID=A0AC35TNT7_9BILA